ncbi:MAG: PA14 domain-containing protein, partial [Vicinamibacterales bacterium]|nr:PA14 domain-containing protein [Vicinamibacterales bacterium]
MRLDGRGRRVVRWYIPVALTLTAFGGILHWLVAPPIGLVRTVYADIGFAGEPLFEARTTDISLAFLDEDPTLPRRFFSVEWRGFWFLPRAQTVDVYAGGDDRVDVFVDDQLVLRRNFSVGTHTTSETITLGAGSHEIIVRYEQEGGGASLNIQRAIDGNSQRTFLPNRLFSVRPNVQGFLLAAGSYWLTRLVAVVWLGPIAWLFLLALGRASRPVVHRWRTVGAPRTAGDFWRRLQLLAGPTLLGPFVLFLLGPYTSYGANRSEFNTVFSDIAWPWLSLAVGGVWAILLGIGCVICVLSDRLTRIYAALVFAVGVLLWVQGTILVADYGLLLGEGLDLSRHVWRAPYEIALWLGGIGLAAVFARRVSAVAPFGSQLLIALQLIVLVLPFPAAEREARVDAPEWSLPPDEIYQLSRDQNVIHVVLDGFLSETFAQFLEEERGTSDRDFSGFIFFADHLGAFPTTKASMPAMLTGIAYRNEMPIDSFISANIRDRSIYRMLAEQGYQINAVSFIGYDHPPASFPNG